MITMITKAHRGWLLAAMLAGAVTRRRHAVFVLVILPLLGLGQKAAADTTNIGFTVFPVTAVCSESGTSGNASDTCTIPNEGSAILSGTASMGDLAASAQIVNSAAQVEVGSYFQQNVSFTGLGTADCPTTPGVTDCPVGDVKYFAAGTTLTGVMVFSLDGTWSHSDANYAYIHPVTQVDVNGQGYLQNYRGAAGDEAYNQDCNSFGGSYMGPTGQIVPYAACGKGTVSGNISATLVSMPFSFVIGPNYTLGASFDLLVQCGGSCDGNFLDPTLTDIEITDPTTGLTVHGISVTGDDGTVYPVNVEEAASVPEPGAVYLLGFVLIAIPLLHSRRFRP